MIIEFLGVRIEADLPLTELRLLAVEEAVRRLGTFAPEGYTPADLETVRAWALEIVKLLAAEAENNIDNLLSGNFVRMIMLNQEVVTYYQAGRPANPSANIYVIANAMATRRGITLHDMLEILFTKWRNVQVTIAAIVTEMDRLTEAINTAVTIEDIGAILVTIGF